VAVHVNCASLARQVAPRRRGTATLEKLSIVSRILIEMGGGLSLACRRCAKEARDVSRAPWVQIKVIFLEVA